MDATFKKIIASVILTAVLVGVAVQGANPPQVTLSWSIPGWDLTNYTYVVEFWNANFTDQIHSTITIPKASGNVSFTVDTLKLAGKTGWVRVIGRNRFPDTWCDDKSHWYPVQGVIEKQHCTPDIIFALIYVGNGTVSLDSSRDAIYNITAGRYKYNEEKVPMQLWQERAA